MSSFNVTFEFSLWYYGEAWQKSKQFYELLKEYPGLELNFFYGPEDKTERRTERILSVEKIDEMFYKSEAFFPGLSMAMGGKNIRILMYASSFCEPEYYGTCHFNVLSFTIKESAIKKNVISSQTLEKIFLQAIDIYNPIYGFLDDSDKADSLMESEESYKPHEYIQCLFWGNYYGKEYCSCKGIKKVVAADECISAELRNGCFVKLSEKCTDYNSPFVNKRRKKLKEHIIQPLTKRHINKFSRS